MVGVVKERYINQKDVSKIPACILEVTEKIFVVVILNGMKNLESYGNKQILRST